LLSDLVASEYHELKWYVKGFVRCLTDQPTNQLTD